MPHNSPAKPHTRAMELSHGEEGEGAPLVLLHGLTATRRYVLQGSRLLARGGYRLIGYDAGGMASPHPPPSPPPTSTATWWPTCA